MSYPHSNFNQLPSLRQSDQHFQFRSVRTPLEPSTPSCASAPVRMRRVVVEPGPARLDAAIRSDYPLHNRIHL